MAHLSPHGAADSTDVAALVRDEQVRTLYRQSPLVLVGNALSCCIVVAILWRSEPAALLISWIACMLLVAVVRWQIWRAYTGATRPTGSLVLWERAAIAGSATTGILWGFAGALLLRSDSPMSQLLMPFVLGGMGAAAAGTIACHLPTFFAFFLPAMIPGAVKLAVMGGPGYYAMAGLMALFVVLMSGVARNVNRAISGAFRLRFDNERLARQLDGARQQLLADNAELERRVDERTEQIKRQADERAALENDLQAARRLEAIGRLAGGVAHDFNNALSIVLAGTDSLREHLTDAGARAILDDVETSARGAAETSQQLLAFSRGAPEHSGQCSPHLVIERFAASVRRMLPETIEVRVEVSGDGAIALPPSQLERILLNMALNARDALPRGGHICLRSKTEGDRVILEVRDDGIGMDATTRARLFEPYFTTKGMNGSGLGLATAWGMVTNLGGDVQVESEVGRGTLFRFIIPRVVLTPKTDGPVPAKAAAGDVSKHVLLLEDEDGLRRALERLLKKAGYTVSSHGLAAPARAALTHERFDCLLTDAVVPDGGVSDLVRAFVATNPGAPVIVCSGHVGEQALLDGINRDSYHFVAKPFVPNQLLTLVARLLSEGAEPLT